MAAHFGPVAELLLLRRGLVYPSPAGASVREDLGRVASLELAQLGYLPDARLSAALARLGPEPLAELLAGVTGALAKALGADQQHVPLFRRFPHDVPADTERLWWDRVLVHFLQGPAQPCVLCGRTGTVHVLRPCEHLACDQCFDGSSYAGCPICNRHVDLSSPFFRADEAPKAERTRPHVQFKLLGLGADLEADARALFVSLCSREQPISPADAQALHSLLAAYHAHALAWVPEKIPVKENVAHVFGALFRSCGPANVLPVARLHLKTATDVLRLIAVYSGAEPGLLPSQQWRKI
ncbi:MAG TPA: RING finger family 4 domain-containing protein, partial [Solirubrobacterales bacterium]|nr:RING finger family 4 domain-containing protein [Solirubrobacterales bacterium]